MKRLPPLVARPPLPGAGAPARAAAPDDLAVGRRVLRVDVENPSGVQEWEVRELFLLRAGDPYDPAVVQRGLSLLAQKQGVRTVTVTGEEEGEGLVVRVTVVPEPLIRSLSFTGNRAFRDKEVSAKVRTAVDEPVSPPLLEADSLAVADLYVEEGYLGARVVPQVEPRKDPLWVDVSFRVEEGAPARITRVDLGDTGGLGEERALSVLGLEKGSRASLRKLRTGVQALLKAYRAEGYVEARVSNPHFERDGEGAALIVPLAAGTPVDVRVEGIDGSTDKSLLDVVREHYGEVVDQDWADKVASGMAETLRARGHRQALVAPELEELEGRRRVTFRTSPGPLVRVREVLFEGNASEKASKLKGYMALVEGGFFRPPPFTQESLDRDLKTLGDYYVSQGFLDARVTVASFDVAPDGAAALKLRVEEGTRFRIGRLEFRCDSGLTPEEALKVSELAPGQHPSPSALDEAKIRLLAEIAKKGYADAAVDYAAKRGAEAGTLDVDFHVKAADLVRFGKIVVSGNARTRTGVILREVTFKEGDPWNAQEVVLSRQKLFRLGFFQKVRIEPLDPASTASVRDVKILVEEQDAGSVSFSFGYGTEEGLNGSAEVAHANLQGAGRSARLRAGVEGKDWSASATFGEPWFLGYRLDLVATLLRQYQTRPGYDVLTTGFQLSLDRKVTERIRASLLYTLEDNTLSNVATDADVKDVGQYLLSAFGPVVAWDSRNDPFNPTEGYQHTVQAEWALSALGSEVQYGRYVGMSSGFFTAGRVTLALLGRAGFAENFGKTAELPANKRFYLGGRTTVRGFGRDEVGPKADDGSPLGGDTMINFRAELRFPIWKGIGGDVFWDAGNVWNRQIDRPDYLNLRHGVGTGLRYLTPIGPISLDIGYKLDAEEDESKTEWYFTIGNVF
ncbi:MAG: outer membrane protein assembly factor BamA [Deltaproteobacteria bacterium]|nr:outer membrane protein assembly factor BamA [Deltaproteobacteria bacterium]